MAEPGTWEDFDVAVWSVHNDAHEIVAEFRSEAEAIDHGSHLANANPDECYSVAPGRWNPPIKSSVFPIPAPAPTEGQIDLNGDALRKPSIHEQPYACCDKALVLPPGCVCFFMSTCPDHGTRHNGTHD